MLNNKTNVSRNNSHRLTDIVRTVVLYGAIKHSHACPQNKETQHIKMLVSFKIKK